MWWPTTNRLAVRIAPLAVKPSRVAERIQEAVTDPDPRNARRLITEPQLDAVRPAPSGPNGGRARAWVAEGPRFCADKHAGASGPLEMCGPIAGFIVLARPTPPPPTANARSCAAAVLLSAAAPGLDVVAT